MKKNIDYKKMTQILIALICHIDEELNSLFLGVSLEQNPIYLDAQRQRRSPLTFFGQIYCHR